MNFHLTLKSSNIKTGPIPVSMSPRFTCPITCPLRHDGGCYGENYGLMFQWNKLDRGHMGVEWSKFCGQIKVMKAPIWRHNQVGDLPTVDRVHIDHNMMIELIDANGNRDVICFTHYNPLIQRNADIIRHANTNGFTVNLSANNLLQADQFADLNIGPVVTLLPKDAKKVTFTPDGRKVILCPAQQMDNMTCEKCKLCSKRDRSYIIGFAAHGTRANKVNKIINIVAA